MTPTLLVPFALEGFYARPARTGVALFVIFIPTKLSADFDTNFGTWFRANGGRGLASERDRTHVAVLCTAPNWLRHALLQALPSPPSRGTYTLGNFLDF